MFKPEDQLPKINEAIVNGWKFRQGVQLDTYVVKAYTPLIPGLQALAGQMLCVHLRSPTNVTMSTKLADLAVMMRDEVVHQLRYALDPDGKVANTDSEEINSIAAHVESAIRGRAVSIVTMHEAMDRIERRAKPNAEVTEVDTVAPAADCAIDTLYDSEL